MKFHVDTVTGQFIDSCRFPQVIGWIDVTYVPVKQPCDNEKYYFSYKLLYLNYCQAIWNAFGSFTNIEVRLPGSVHDTRFFLTLILRFFSNKTFDMYYKEILLGSSWVPQLIFRGPTYPLWPYVMKFDSCQTEGQVIFTQLLRSTQNQIEHTFGCLKARWRILRCPLDVPAAYTQYYFCLLCTV